MAVRGLLAVLSVLAVMAPATGIAGPQEPAGSESRVTGGPERLPAGKEVDGEIFYRWTGALERHRDAVMAAARLCSGAGGKPCVFWAWTDFLLRIRGEPPERQLDEVNGYVNRSPYIADPDNWGEPDHWAAPGEFFATGGDCEDFAIAKYFSLRALGFGPEQLKIVVLHDTQRDQAHTVLVVTVQDRSFLLDNRYDMILPWSTASHYRPLYAINERSAWLYAPRPLARSRVRATTVALHERLMDVRERASRPEPADRLAVARPAPSGPASETAPKGRPPASLLARTPG